MMGGPIRLRSRRAVHARRRAGRWRLPVSSGFFALVLGAACWAPLTPTALAPTTPAELGGVSLAGIAALSGPPLAPATMAPQPLLGVAPTATPRPALAPTPAVVPTLTASGRAVLDSITSDRTAQWVKNHVETPLRSAPSEDSLVFTRLPQWSILKQIGSKPDWLLVQYSGDGDTRQAGPGWVKASDVGAVEPPLVWITSANVGALWSAWDSSARRMFDVPRGTMMEVIGLDFIRSTRVHVRLPGDGRAVPPSEGWVDGDVVARAATPSVYEVPWAYPEDLHADIRIRVPYRSQLDGSDYAGSNCGPTVLGMALESFGMNTPPADLRGQVLSSENFDPDDTDAGSFIWALALVAQSHGLQPHGLYKSDGELHRWNLDEIRASLQQGQPVIVQVRYRGLPGRADSAYYGDHYIIITGLLGDRFLYNDPIGGAAAHEAPGYDRVISAAQLQWAMRASDTGYAYSAFGVSR